MKLRFLFHSVLAFLLGTANLALAENRAFDIRALETLCRAEPNACAKAVKKALRASTAELSAQQQDVRMGQLAALVVGALRDGRGQGEPDEDLILEIASRVADPEQRRTLGALASRIRNGHARDIRPHPIFGDPASPGGV